ncbi:MAG: DUF1330 domain-containing protein [Woeseiaceae bacterium]
MKTYLVFDISVHDMDRYKGYVALAPGYVEKHQGKYLVRGGAMDVIEGDWAPQRVVVIEFPSKDLANAFLNDQEYQAVAEDRRNATTSKMIMVEGT